MPEVPDTPPTSYALRPPAVRIYQAVGSAPTAGFASAGAAEPSFLVTIWRCRHLSWSLFARGFAARMRQSLLGYLWSVIPPLVMALIFTILARGRVLNLEETALPYPVFALLGLTVWWLFSGILLSATSSLTQAANLIGKVQFPREALLIASLGQPLFETTVRGALVAAVGLVMGVVWHPAALLIPLALAPLVLLALGLGAVLAVLNALARDISGMLNVLLPMAMFLTPVLYPAPRLYPYALINIVNPVSPFVIMTQDLATGAWPRQGAVYLVTVLVSAGIFFLGGRIFSLAQPVIAERI